MKKNKEGFLLIEVGMCLIIMIAIVSLVSTLFFSKERGVLVLKEAKERLDEEYKLKLLNRERCGIECDIDEEMCQSME